MSSNRLNNDTEAYIDTVKQSTGPAKYQMFKSPILNTNFYPTPPSIRLQKSGVSIDSSENLTDVHSNLLNLNIRNSKTAQQPHLPLCKDMCDSGYPCGQGVVAKCINKECGIMSNSNVTHGKECFVPVESTRLSNPPCTLRGLENDRWDYLCMDPQKNLELPFQNNQSIRLYERDNHVPCSNVPLSVKECNCKSCTEITCNCPSCRDKDIHSEMNEDIHSE
tara:strand:+ start:258 stop:920 length:663 start_codon:yes stop_codon:yes gene_type:complete